MNINTLFAIFVLPGVLTFSAQSAIPFEYKRIGGPYGLVEVCYFGDFNGDGLPDPYIATMGGPVIWWESPDLIKHEVFHDSNIKWSCNGESADVDNDGDIDIVSQGWHSNADFWLENPGNGTNNWSLHKIGDRTYPHDIEDADLDGDGDIDVISRSEYWYGPSKDIRIWRQNSPDSWTSKDIYCSREGGGLDVADIDGDGDLDIIAPGEWFENPGGDIINSTWVIHTYDSNSNRYGKTEAADLNQDGRLDIVVNQSETHAAIFERGPISWYEGPANPKAGPWTKHIIEEDMGDLHSLAIGDMDNDGDLDIFTAEMDNGTVPYDVLIYVNNGRASSWTKDIVATSGSHEAQILDYDGDGDLDIFGINMHGPMEMWENKTDPEK